MVAQRVVERQIHRGFGETLEVARGEEPGLTTAQPREY
jgi:hypothetical protein